MVEKHIHVVIWLSETTIQCREHFGGGQLSSSVSFWEYEFSSYVSSRAAKQAVFLSLH